MSTPAISSPAVIIHGRNRAAVVDELRRLLPRLESAAATARALPFGLAPLDAHLPQGGLTVGALHEVAPHQHGDTAAAAGFLVALLARFAPAHVPAKACPGLDPGWAPVRRQGHAPIDQSRACPDSAGMGHAPARPMLFIAPSHAFAEHGRPHGHGLQRLGLDPARLILVETRNEKQALWAMEEALRSTVPAAIGGAVAKLDLKASQRLQLAAGEAGLPLLLLRPATIEDASAAATRWRVGAAQAARDRFGLIERTRWNVQLERCRNGRLGDWLVEFDHAAYRFSLAAALADPALSRGADAQSKLLRRAG
jgi:protein ImuA